MKETMYWFVIQQGSLQSTVAAPSWEYVIIHLKYPEAVNSIVRVDHETIGLAPAKEPTPGLY